MSIKDNSFPAKILLFGEYTILLGSSALSIPYDVFSAVLKFPDHAEPSSSRKQVTSNHHLFKFYEYLARQGEHLLHTIDFEKFHFDLVQGLFLQSTIPAGYGLGSSGSLVAAVFERFARYLPSNDEIATCEALSGLKRTFSEMESFFHGKSSGFDPCVSFLKRPLLLTSDGVPEITILPEAFSTGGSGIFLLNTEQTGKTAPLVKDFINKFTPGGKFTEEGNALVQLTNQLVNSFLDFSEHHFWELMKRFSRSQFEDFRLMIPQNFTSLWLDGAENELFYLKLCGSGGGGYLIGFSPDLTSAITFLENGGYHPVPVKLPKQ